MNAYPAAPDLIADAVRFLREAVAPRLDGADAFNLRVTINALEIVERELRQGERARARDDAWLDQSVGPQGGREAQIARLCARLAGGPADPALMRELRRSTLDQLAIDQPGYSAYRAALASGEAQPSTETPLGARGSMKPNI